MLGKQRAEQIFQNPDMSSTIFKKKAGEEEHDLKFYEEHLKCETPIAFSSMIVSHIRLSKCNRGTRSFIIWILAIAIVAAAFIGMVYFNDYNESLLAFSAANVACPPELEVIVAFEDFLKPLK